MILTEREAKTKRCQESFGDGFVTEQQSQIWAPTGRSAHSSPLHCIGSACMAWRWGEVERDDVTGKVLENVAGYCGKAGKP